MKHIAVLLPGIIREYDKLENISKMREFGLQNNISFYFFGVTYNFSGNPKNYWFADKDVDENIPLNKSVLNELNLDKIQIETEVIQKDKDGYDGRILAQWKLVYTAFTLATEYESEMNIKFDLVFRSRWDIDIKLNKLNKLFYTAYNEQKICIVKYRTISDQSFVGNPQLMKRVISIYDLFYEYLKLPEFVERENKHQEKVKLKSNIRDRKNHKNLRFVPQSELMLTYHINNALDVKTEVKNMGHRNKWWKLRNIK